MITDTDLFYDTSFFYSSLFGHKITIAYKRSRDRGLVVFGAAFCSTHDRFMKSMGRNIAEGRLECRPQTILIDAGMTRFDMHHIILMSVRTLPYAPTSLSDFSVEETGY